MATRIKMLKLLQEVRGFAQFAHQPAEPKAPGPLLLEFGAAMRRRAAARRKRAIKIEMQEPPDIPHPVPIKYLSQPD